MIVNKLNLKYVSEKIGESYKDWKKGNVILIDAQTGTGKNWFIENVLIPHIEDKKLLFISNRTNLKRQIKIRLLKEYGLDIPKTLEELDKKSTIKNITITSYHALQFSAQNEIYDDEKFNVSYFDYLVMDECHFILSDSSFNYLNRLSFEKLVKKQYPNIIKIFMSATMDEIKPSIIKYAEKGFGSTTKVISYETDRDYSYVNVKYFKHYKYTETISNMILNDKTDEKWLIFISDLKAGRTILKIIGEDKGSIIQAGTKDNKELDSIINDNCFTKKVLIATKALDNGINIKDDKLTNIVIMAFDKIGLIQMLGRKRIDIENAQNINLYISSRSPKSFKGLLRKYDIKQKGIDLLHLKGDNKNSFNKKYHNKFAGLVILNDVIYIDSITKEFMYNTLGGARLAKDNDFATKMVELFENDKFAFIKKQLSWLELSDTFDASILIEDVILDSKIETLEEYLNSIVGEVMFQAEDRIELINKIHLIDTHHSNIKKNRIKLLKNIDTLNGYLNEIGINFTIKEFKTSQTIDNKKTNYKSAWKIMRLSNE